MEIWGEKFNASKIEREIFLGKKYFPRINTIRLWLSHDAFIRNPITFTRNFEIVLKIGEKYGLSFIPVLFNGWHSYPDFGGISPEQIFYWGSELNFFKKVYFSYLKAIVSRYRRDERILLWDLCNEPFNSAPSQEAKDIILRWLTKIYYTCKKFGVKSPICVGSIPGIDAIKLVEPISDVITFHPYYAWNAWVKSKKDFKNFLDESVVFANKVNKPLLATETGWGSLNDKQRSETLIFELKELKKRNIGWTAHLLHHTLVADGHKLKFGPISAAGYMAFIELNGSLRPYHEVYNEY
ncbi:MAG: cellulase family glycosylhydrolase [Candidatus Omnitrophota bacterium]